MQGVSEPCKGLAKGVGSRSGKQSAMHTCSLAYALLHTSYLIHVGVYKYQRSIAEQKHQPCFLFVHQQGFCDEMSDLQIKTDMASD